MRFQHLWLPILVLATPLIWAQEEQVSAERLEACIEWLADDDRGGRRSPGKGWDETGTHLADSFDQIGLEPIDEDEGYFQEFTSLGRRGRNVVGILRGTNPGSEHIVVGAHYDHLGIDGGTGEPCNGADDNASGVAALLECARLLSRVERKRHIVFAAFDLEEMGMLGSAHYADHPALPVEDTVAMVCLDMLGRSLLDQTSGHVLAFGAEHSAGVDRALARAAGASGDKVWKLGTDFVGPRSDFTPFSSREIPYLFLTTGTHRDYHRIGDDEDEIDYESFTCHTRLVLVLTRELANADERPTWSDAQPDMVEEARAIEEITGILLERADSLRDDEKNRLGSGQVLFLRIMNFRARTLVERGRVSQVDRYTLMAGCYVLVFMAFEGNPFKAMTERIERFFK